MTSTKTGGPRRPQLPPRPATRLEQRNGKPTSFPPDPQLPRRWVDSVLPIELPPMAREIIRRIRDEIPEYRRAMDGPYGRSIRESTEAALIGFVNQFFRCGSLTAESEQFFRELGRREALEGRNSDVLQSAFRVGSLAAWNRLLSACEREPLPASTVGALAATIFGFADLLARLAGEGYASARRDDALVQARLRARLARMITNSADVPAEAIQELAARLEWPVPERVAVLDLRFDEGGPDPYAAVLANLGSAALAELEPGARFVVVPAPVDCHAVRGLANDLPGTRITIGCQVAFDQAAESLRLARLATRLQNDGVLAPDVVVDGDSVIPVLLVRGIPGIADLLVTRRLGPLSALPPARRRKFARLLSVWLESGGTQADLAETLGMHRQTLHYQVGRLQEMFGEDLRTPDARLEIMLALRAVLPEWDPPQPVRG